MTPTQPPWPQVKALFEQALDLPSAERAAFVLSVDCDAATRQELQSLLLHHEASGRGDALGAPGFLHESVQQMLARSSPNGGAASGADHAGNNVVHIAGRVGQRLGAWEIVRAIGSGGMGEVFEARRADGQYQGRAAIKLLKRGMDSAAVLHRFAQERQALARLSHRHIARLLDAGASEEGLPYFVMDYVQGLPIDQAGAGLALEARLGLFLQLADAVAHAHRNLLVHRDLKPANVLVDGQGQVKLLDFGIAKAIDPLESAGGSESHSTVASQRPYTPHYASPEQVRGEPVSTATDIYSLGVLLYQMLTGTRPTGRAATTPAEAVRSVLEEEPTRPSRLSPTEAVDPRWLQTRKKLEGDLDNILLKALQKPIERRYASVDAMAADVQAFLQGRPVSARSPKVAYVLGKFVRRNRWAVLAGALGGLGLAAGLAAALLQGRPASALGVIGLAAGLLLALVKGRQAEVARSAAVRHVAELRQFSRELVVEYGDAITYVPGGMQRKAAMLRTTLSTLHRLLRDGEADPHLQAEIAALHARLADLQCAGNFNAHEEQDEADRNAQQAVVLFTQAERGVSSLPSRPQSGMQPGAKTLDAATFRWWGRALCVQAKQAQARGDPARALRLLRQSESLLLRALQRFPGHDDLVSEQGAVLQLMAEAHYGWNKVHLGQSDDALAVLQQASTVYQQAVQRRQPPRMEDVFQVGTMAGTRALILARQERWAEALTAAQQALLWRQKAALLEPHNRVVAGAVAAERNLLGGLCINSGRAAQALAHTRVAWVELQALLTEDATQQTWLSQRRFLALNHGRALLAVGQPAEALSVLQVSADWLTALRDAAKASPMHLRRLAQTRLAQAQGLHALGRLAEALALARTAAAELQALVQAQPGDRDHALALGECACALALWCEGRADNRNPGPAVDALSHAEADTDTDTDTEADAAKAWRACALSAYQAAERLQVLTADHARRAHDLGVAAVT